MTNRCSVSPVTGAAAWEALFNRVDHLHMAQSWAFGEAKHVAGGWRTRRFVFERDGEPVAIAQVFDKSLAGFRWASRLCKGPLFLNADPPDDVVRDVYRALRDRWKYFHGVLVLAPALPACPENAGMMAALGYRRRDMQGWCSARVDLRLDEDQLRKAPVSAWRNRLKKAESAGLTLRISRAPEDIEWIVARHAENMEEKDFVGPEPALVRALSRTAGDDFLVLQAQLDGAAVGGMVAYRFGHTAEYYIGWFGPEGRAANVGNFLYWQGALEMRRRGCRWLDLGGYSCDDRYGRFKRGMRGEEYELVHEWLAF